MAEETKVIQAREVYRTVCAALDNRDWRYEKVEDELLVHFRVSGDDLPMQFIIQADADRQLLRLHSPMTFKISEAKRLDGAIAATAASYGMALGSFDYDLSDGTISFRLNSCFRDSTLGEGQVQFMLSLSCVMVDEYNDQFLALEKGAITIEHFLEKTNQ